MNGKELDAYVKQQVEAYRLQAKSFNWPNNLRRLR